MTHHDVEKFKSRLFVFTETIIYKKNQTKLCSLHGALDDGFCEIHRQTL